ncbi:BrnA antitoxin family protein [Sphingomonas glacialis]|nr:BrnA antitoxin family protein [Sphingomonas glacialis]
MTLRHDPDVSNRFRAEGPGWQGRMNAALRKAVGL